MSITVTSSASGTPAAKSNGYVAGTLTFASLNGGNYSAGTVCIAVVTGDASTPASPKIGSVNLTLIVSATDGGAAYRHLYYADVPDGTTDSVTFTNGSDFNHVAVIGWFMTGAAAGGPSSSVTTTYGGSANPQSIGPITIPAGGVALVAGLRAGAGSITPTWTNTTSSGGDQTTSNASIEVVGAHCVTSGSQTITCTGTGFAYAWGGVMAAWAAAPSGTSTMSMMGV